MKNKKHSRISKKYVMRVWVYEQALLMSSSKKKLNKLKIRKTAGLLEVATKYLIRDKLEC